MLRTLAFGSARTGPVAPSVGIIDDFGARRMDIDGDNVPDFSHGELVERFLLTQCPEARVTRIDVNPESHLGLPDDSIELFRQHYHNILKAVQSIQPGQFDTLNLSMGVEVPLASDQLSPERSRALLRDFLLNSNSPLQTWAGQTAKALAALAREGQKIFLPAGNGGSRKANLYGLAPGVTNVGATTADPQHITDYSHRHSLVTDYAQGTFAVTKVRGGFDLTGDDTPEIRNTEVSGGIPFTRRFVGAPLSAVMASDAEIQAVKTQQQDRVRREDITQLQHRLFPLATLLDMGLMDDVAVRHYSTLGDYAALNPRPYMHTGMWYVFKKKDGRVSYDPDGSGRKNAINQLEGASFSTPLLNGQHLQRQFRERLEQPA